MKVQFQFTAADMAELAGRVADRSPLVQKWRQRARGAWAILIGVVAFFVAPGTPEVRAAIALIIALALFLMTTRQGGGANRNAKLREYYLERLGGDGPFTCEVELTDDGVVSRQLGNESKHAWSRVASVSEVPGGIEFVYRPLGNLLVRDRAFADAQTRAEFLAVARKQKEIRS
jgi:hypothetical protein